ncbi:MAG: DUF2958 domain-containing protein [Novosphingobium sp.]|nr:DUF2958 domain-containing protein [Novosphingobium sp.]
MELLTPALRAALRANALASEGVGHDPVPVLKLFNPMSAATWLATELDADGDTLFGLADLGFGFPELGSFSLSEIAAVRLRYGLRIERDLGFMTHVPLSVWAATARQAGSILWAAQLLRDEERARRATDAPARPASDELPPSGSEDG